MKYYLFSLQHRRVLSKIGEPERFVQVGGGYRPYTIVTKDPSSYKYSDVKVVTTCADNETLATKGRS